MDIGIGANLKLGDGGGGSLVAVTPLLALNPPEPDFGTWEYVEVDGAAVRKSIPTVDDPGEWSFECAYTAAVMARLQAVRGLEKAWQVDYTDGGRWAGNAILKKASSVPGETGQVIVCNVRCSGAWTFDDSP